MVYSIIQKSQLEGALRIDAEYYQPEYLEFERKVKSDVRNYKLWKDIKGRFITGPFGSEFHVENYIKDGKFRYIRGKDVKEFFLLDNDNVFVPADDFNRLEKYSLNSGDILISVVGTLGNIVLVDNKDLPAIFSCKSTAFRTSDISTYFFVAYLNSKYGKGFLERSVRGAVQTGLNIDDLKNLPIYIPRKELQMIIENIVKDAKINYQNSKLFYKQAESILLEEIKINRTIEKASFVENYSEVLEAERMDAEYFQPKYKELIRHIKENCHGVKLGDLVSIKKGFEPGAGEYKEEGKLFIRVSSLSKNGIDNNDQKYLSERLYNELKDNFQPKPGEILLTKDATPGVAYAVKENIEGIISSGILRLKLKNNEIKNEYLTLCLNSIVGQMQAERDAGGSVIAHWKPDQIKNVMIPILPKEKQEKISSLIRESFSARVKAKELLAEAKRKVEDMIEKGGE